MADPRINSLNTPFLEALYAQFRRDPASVPPDYRAYFESMPAPAPNGFAPGPTFHPPGLFDPGRGPAPTPAGGVASPLQYRVDQLVRNFRVRGHRLARIDPLDQPREQPPELDPAACGLAPTDMDRRFVADLGGEGESLLPLHDILDRLRDTYCRSIGVQYMHIDDLVIRRWLQQRMETTGNRTSLSRDEQVRIFTRLTDAAVFEEFIQKKFIGAKSFSLEGAETLIPLLDLLLDKAADQGVDEVVFGMAHRGRLNVLANIIGKSPALIFREFEDRDADLYARGGDVKYHLGFSGNWQRGCGPAVHLSLSFNPSHLEFINPVAVGRTRVKQDRAADADRRRKLCVLIHGDASFAGEGIVQETLNLSALPGYRVGGVVHIVVDNQIGFTTPPEQGRSTHYCTGIARMLQAPIFLVNGEDPEAVAQVVRLAMDFRCEFARDVFIAMMCYRRLGHNETDEPRFTQPQLYAAIDARTTVRDAYLGHLLTLGGLTRDDAERIARKRHEKLESELARSRADAIERWDHQTSIWRDYFGGLDKPTYDVDTGAPRDQIERVLRASVSPPKDFAMHPRLKRFADGRIAMATGQSPLDWAAAEAAAIGTLAITGHRVRFTGQDCQRGTFSQRHAVLHDLRTGRQFCPLAGVAADQAAVEFINSPLCENAALGYEYGYSLGCPNGLVVWEAQFGDFANAAQVMIDQFIASAQDKWCRLSGLVLLLPHGLEGQGPEHSSGRIERFLELAADDNMQIVYPTTPAQYFHALRRQVLRVWRKPLIVFTPKSLLRSPAAVSPLDDLAAGRFARVLVDAGHPQSPPPRRIIACSGKVYYELAARRDKLKLTHVPIIRVEQLYPLPTETLREALAHYPAGTPLVWVQEEPENQGAWRFWLAHFGMRWLDKFPVTRVSRPAMTSPASGSHSAHELTQARLLDEAFAGL